MVDSFNSRAKTADINPAFYYRCKEFHLHTRRKKFHITQQTFVLLFIKAGK